jgi:tRNA (cytosine40_48-C5)-methyltransferase
MNFFIHRYKKMGHIIDPEKIKLKEAIRINTFKIDEKKIIKRLKKNEITINKISFLKQGYFTDADFSIGSTEEYLLGYYYLQEAASQCVSEVLNPKETDLVLDMCAAPGSKTTHLSQIMNNKGIIIAIDIHQKRIEALKNNIERMGCENIIVYRKDAKYVNDLNLKFDKILLDAPCSGNFLIEKDWFEKRTIDDIQKNANEQKKLISSAIRVLKKNGTLIYSTCSLEPEENEEIVEYALNKFNIKLEKIEINIGEEGLTEKTRLCKRFWPEKTNTQGFFIAKIIKIN